MVSTLHAHLVCEHSCMCEFACVCRSICVCVGICVWLLCTMYDCMHKSCMCAILPWCMVPICSSLINICVKLIIWCSLHAILLGRTTCGCCWLPRRRHNNKCQAICHMCSMGKAPSHNHLDIHLCESHLI